MVTAIPTGESFSRSPTFMIDGREVNNPCVETTPAANCVVNFLGEHDVNEVVADNIGRRAKELLREEGISITTSSSGNPAQGGSFEDWLRNKGKFLLFTGTIIGVTYGAIRLYKRLKGE